MKKIVFDIETNGLEPTLIWCVAVREVSTAKELVFTSEVAFKDYFYSEQMEIIGHNIIGYDIPALKKLWNVDFTDKKVTDTLVMSRLSNPSRDGGHSLENWGAKLGCPKGEHNDWTVYTESMVEYCKQDVRVNERVYTALLNELTGFGSECLVLEHQTQEIIARQISIT